MTRPWRSAARRRFATGAGSRRRRHASSERSMPQQSPRYAPRRCRGWKTPTNCTMPWNCSPSSTRPKGYRPDGGELFAALAGQSRATRLTLPAIGAGPPAARWIAAERLPLWQALVDPLRAEPPLQLPAALTERVWRREEALREGGARPSGGGRPGQRRHPGTADRRVAAGGGAGAAGAGDRGRGAARRVYRQRRRGVV